MYMYVRHIPIAISFLDLNFYDTLFFSLLVVMVTWRCISKFIDRWHTYLAVIINACSLVGAYCAFLRGGSKR